MWLVRSHKTTSPTEYKHGARKHLWMRGMQTSLATGPKPRASAYERGLTNLSTSQSTYANHQVIFKPYVVYEHPSTFPQLFHTSNGCLGQVFIAPKSKLAVGGKLQLST